MAGQLGFAEAFVSSWLGRNQRLEELHGLVDWAPIAAIAGRLRPGDMGRPPYEPLSMVQALYLQALYDLSDRGLEEALLDRLSFRRFRGFALDAETPDETTLCRFRKLASEQQVAQACFAAITRQLAARGLVARKGTLMDATIVKARHNRPPLEAGRGASHPNEPDAGWTAKGGKSHFGYKLHVGMDAGGLVRRAVLTSAAVYESEAADALICGDEAAVYGDRAHEQKARRARLAAKGIKDRTMRRANKWHPVLPPWQRKGNHLIARRRAPVEAVFSTLKRHYGFARARYASLARNAARAFAALTMLNLLRSRTRLAAT
ncbi:MAG: IS5 family transposase [Acetobacteraceae bacterium]